MRWIKYGFAWVSIGIILFLLAQMYLLPHYMSTGTREGAYILAEACKRYNQGMKTTAIDSERWFSMVESTRPRLYYSDAYRVVVCGVPKCASTEWRKLLLILEKDLNVTSPHEIEHELAFTEAIEKRFLWRKYRKYNSETAYEVNYRLNMYYKIMTVREPLQRVVSAYVDKMLPGGTAVEIYKNISRRIHKHYGSTYDDDGRATFKEFVTHILNTPHSTQLDIHWRPISDICDPCTMKYDYIVRLETFVSDAAKIASTLGIDADLIVPEKREDPGKLQHKWEEKYMKYLRQITSEEAEKLYQYYKRDYDMFNYPKPSFLRPLLGAS